MKSLFICFAVLISTSSFGITYCDKELEKNSQLRKEIIAMVDVTEAQKVILLEMNENARESVLLSCGMATVKSKYNYCTDELERLEESRLNILSLEDISEETRSVLLKMNENAKSSVLATMSVVCE